MIYLRPLVVQPVFCQPRNTNCVTRGLARRCTSCGMSVHDFMDLWLWQCRSGESFNMENKVRQPQVRGKVPADLELLSSLHRSSPPAK